MDQLVIYYSRPDRRWIAHSLRTDQIGSGEHPLAAMVDAMKAIRQIMAMAHEDPSINPWREAPPAIHAKATKSEALPEAIGDLALRIVSGRWPKHLRVTVEPRNISKPLRADLLAVGY